MRLRDLGAWFVYNASATGYSRSKSDRIGGQQGVMFECPTCTRGHYILVYFANPIGAEVAPPEADKNPRWKVSGTSLDDLTLTPSVNCDVPWKDAEGVEHPSSCKFHGVVTNGDVA